MDYNYDTEPHPHFVQGFNEGYFLAQEMPQFASDMGKYMPQSERGDGFNSGIEHYTRELARQRQDQAKTAFKDNKGDAGVDKNSRANLHNGFKETKVELGIDRKDKYTDWLDAKEENKQDLGIDREPHKDNGDKEPELD